MDKEKIQKAIELLKLANTGTITPKELKQFIDQVLSFVAEHKNSFEKTSKENLKFIKEAVDYIESKYKDIVEISNTQGEFVKEKISKENKELLDEIIKTKKEFLDLKPKDGKDADPEYIIAEVLDRIELPEIPDFKNDTGEIIVDKINDLPLEDVYKIDASHIKNLPLGGKAGIGGNRYLSKLADVALDTLTDGNTLVWDSAINKWVNGLPGGTAITLQVDGTNNTDQNTLNLITGSNITLTDNGAGGVIIDANTPAGQLETAFTNQTTLTITHNFGEYPSWSIYDSSGYAIIPLTFHNDSVNAVTITFTSSTSGTVVLVGGAGGGGGGAVTSVFGRSGIVTAQTGDYSTDDVTESTNLYFTDERAQDAVGSILTDSATIEWTYDDAGNTISADVIGGGIASLNGLTAGTQTFAVGTSGTDFAISSSTSTHTFNIPDASDTARGFVNTTIQTFEGAKTFADVPLTTGGNPTTDNELARKAYVDAVALGAKPKLAVRVATTVAGTLASDFENGDTIDGVVLATNDRIMIKNQADDTQNGIYTVNASGAPTRATDYDAAGEINQGTFFAILEGTDNENSIWIMYEPDVVTVGSDPINFSFLANAINTVETSGNIGGTGVIGDPVVFTGTLPIANGGTNNTSFTTDYLTAYNGTSIVNSGFKQTTYGLKFGTGDYNLIQSNLDIGNGYFPVSIGKGTYFDASNTNTIVGGYALNDLTPGLAVSNSIVSSLKGLSSVTTFSSNVVIGEDVIVSGNDISNNVNIGWSNVLTGQRNFILGSTSYINTIGVVYDSAIIAGNSVGFNPLAGGTADVHSVVSIGSSFSSDWINDNELIFGGFYDSTHTLGQYFTDVYFGAGKQGNLNNLDYLTDFNMHVTGAPIAGLGYTDINGTNFNFYAGQGSGSGTGGKFTWKTSDSTGVPSDDTLQTFTNKMELGNDGALQLLSYGLGNITGTPTYTLGVDASGNVIEIAGGGGASTFLALTDTPANYTGSALKFVRVNAGETGLEFATVSGVGTVTGTGTDNHIMRWNGTADAQDSGITISDLNAITGVTALTVDNLTLDGSTLSSSGQVIISPTTTTYLKRVADSFGAILQTSSITTSDKTFTFPNATGTLALTTAITSTGTDVSWSTNGGLNIPSASGSARGVVTTGAQTFAGAKTLTGRLLISKAGGGSSSMLSAQATSGSIYDMFLATGLTTTDATTTTLISKDTSGRTGTVRVRCFVTATASVSNKYASFTIDAVLQNITGSVWNLLYSNVNVDYRTDATWSATIDTSSSNYRIRVTGGASDTVAWYCTLQQYA